MILYVLSFVLLRLLRLVWGVIRVGLVCVGLLWFLFYLQGESAAGLWLIKHLFDLIW